MSPWRRWIAALSWLLVALAGTVATAQQAKTAPDLRGRTCEEARRMLEPLHYRIQDCPQGTARFVYPPGTINLQSAEPGAPLGRLDGLKVELEPPRPVTPPPPPPPARRLPDLRRGTCEQARAQLDALRTAYTSCETGAALDGFSPGRVNAQSRPPGTVLPVKTLVLTVQPPASETRPPVITPPPPPPPSSVRRVPDLRGDTCDQARAQLAALGAAYTSCEIGAARDGFSPGRVNAQSRAPGTVLPVKTLVLTVQPQALVVVPDLTGLPEAQALSLLAARGLRASPAGPTAALGRRVLAQSPPFGASVPPDSTVSLRLGLSVPRLLGMDCAAARDLAARYGQSDSQCEPRPSDSPGRPIGQVFEQVPDSHTPPQASPTPIRLRVWAAQPVTVPDVRKLRLPAAIARLDRAKLVAQPDSAVGDRDVTAQQPDAGAVVDAGSRVQLKTALMAEVPDVAKLSLPQARATLKKAHFTSAPDSTDHPDQRVIVAQTPAAGSRVPVNTVIALVTTRPAPVPDLLGDTCAQAEQKTRSVELALDCDAEESWRTHVFGAPRIDRQTPQWGGMEPVGTQIHVSAQAPLPPELEWLRRVSLPVAAAGVSVPILALAMFLFRPKPLPAPDAQPPSASASSLSMRWRVEPDLLPVVNVRGPAVEQSDRHRLPIVRWRVVPDPGHVVLREFDPQTGVPHVHD